MQAELGSQELDDWSVLVHYAYVARYEYSDVVVQNDNFLMVSPYGDQYQTTFSHDVLTIPQGRKVKYADRLNNTVHRVRITVPHQELTISAIGELCLKSPEAPISDVSLDAVTYDLATAEFLSPAPLVDPATVSDAAREVSDTAKSLLEAVSNVVGWVHREVQYQRGNTGVHTTAEQVLSFMEGVCQDKTHLALGMLRALGIPARYVSGLLTRQAGETHAWLEFWHPQEGWLPADPTRGTVVDVGVDYLKFAVGRDYTEVPPVAGSFVSTGSGQLVVATARVFFDKDNVSFDDAWLLLEPDSI